ncbi:MAG: branched-chain amino acid ABC transporter permease [Desulfobulbaceae bacterium]|nr:MAG: branched-chain amino acid ABC transporter permease [Desulfobulbaceae bacterium]
MSDPKFRQRAVIGFGLLILCLLPPLAHLFGQEYFISLSSRILIYALAAVSLDLLIGYGGLISLGHAAFFGVGAYVVGVMYYHGYEGELLFHLIPGSENGLVVLPLAVMISALFALVIGAISLRTSGMHFIMITLAFAQMLYYFFIGLEKYGGDDGLTMYARNSLPFADLSNDSHFYYVCLGLLLLFVFLMHRLINSRFGLVLRGASKNSKRAQATGINVFYYQLVGFTIAGAGAGLAGALLANQTEYVSPGLLHWPLSGELMVMVLLGGLGTLVGPILGAAVFLLLEEFLGMYTEHWMIYLGPFLIIVVIFAKKGLYGLLIGIGGEHDT